VPPFPWVFQGLPDKKFDWHFVLVAQIPSSWPTIIDVGKYRLHPQDGRTILRNICSCLLVATAYQFGRLESKNIILIKCNITIIIILRPLSFYVGIL
jgi:hypothetical protein